MSLDTVIAELDGEIEALQARVNQKQPDQTFDAFARLCALTHGRTLLRTARATGVPTASGLDFIYAGVRRKVKADE